MKKSSCGINREGVLRGLRRSMVVFIGPYSCLFWRICRAYAEVGLLTWCTLYADMAVMIMKIQQSLFSDNIVLLLTQTISVTQA